MTPDDFHLLVRRPLGDARDPLPPRDEVAKLAHEIRELAQQRLGIEIVVDCLGYRDDERDEPNAVFGSVSNPPCALKKHEVDSHGFLTCDRCRHCAPPLLIEDWCVDA